MIFVRKFRDFNINKVYLIAVINKHVEYDLENRNIFYFHYLCKLFEIFLKKFELLLKIIKIPEMNHLQLIKQFDFVEI